MRMRLLSAVLGVLCASCVANRAYRSSDCARPDELSRKGLTCSSLVEQLRTGEFDQVEAAVSPDQETLSWPYRLAFLEFKDDGTLLDPGELDKAKEAIAAAQTDARALSAKVDTKAVVVFFVHGWKNNASDGSGNVWGFRQVLGGISKQFGQPRSATNDKVPVVGIYIGWRGASTNVPIVEQFTFWDRRHESQNLPGAPMRAALTSLMKAAKDDPKTLSVMVGHSFGGAVLETALTDILEQSVESSPDHRLQSPVDLIVFLNEAQEALRSYPLIETLIRSDAGNTQDHCRARQVGGENRFDLPAIISISSTGDYATRAFYPFGQAFVRPFKHLQRFPQPDDLGFSSETPMFFSTTAHLKNFQSHFLRIVPVSPAAGAAATDPDMTAALASCDPVLDLTLSGVHYLMVAKPGSNNHTPYWVLQMPPSIVPDHSTIFTPVFRNFLISLLITVTA